MKSVLITGGAGYIGSHAIRPLTEAGYRPVVYDNLSQGHKAAVGDAVLVVGDIADEQMLDTVFREYDIDAVMHFASSCYVGESVTDPQKYFANNVANSITLLRTMLANDVKKFVFSSSCAVYGEPITVPMKETHPQDPVNPYGISKYFVERILKEYGRSYNLRYAILRYFNAAGASELDNIGEAHSPETHLVPLVLKAADKLKVFGEDYNTHDGTCIRDYLHVDDIISAHILSLDAIYANDKSYTFNVGSGTGYTVKEIIKTTEEVTGIKIDYEVVERRPGDVEKLVASPGKINKELVWEPKYKRISDIIRTAWEWHKKNPDGYKD